MEVKGSLKQGLKFPVVYHLPPDVTSIMNVKGKEKSGEHTF